MEYNVQGVLKSVNAAIDALLPMDEISKDAREILSPLMLSDVELNKIGCGTIESKSDLKVLETASNHLWAAKDKMDAIEFKLATFICCDLQLREAVLKIEVINGKTNSNKSTEDSKAAR